MCHHRYISIKIILYRLAEILFCKNIWLVFGELYTNEDLILKCINNDLALSNEINHQLHEALLGNLATGQYLDMTTSDDRWEQWLSTGRHFKIFRIFCQRNAWRCSFKRYLLHTLIWDSWEVMNTSGDNISIGISFSFISKCYWMFQNI